jgi:hypothetical protein
MKWKRSRFGVVRSPFAIIGRDELLLVRALLRSELHQFECAQIPGTSRSSSRPVTRALPDFDSHGQPPDSRSAWSSFVRLGMDANPGAGSTGTVAVCKPTSIKIRFE